MTPRTRRPSAATIVAIFALVVAMGGTAIALQSGDSLIATRTLSGNRLRLNTVTDKEVANLVWHPLTLVNEWVNYNGNQRRPAWALDAQGIVHLRGALAQSSGTNAQFARLPLSIRPPVYVYLVTNLVNAAPGRIYVRPDGRMFAQAYGAQTDAQFFTSLEGITWAR